ncbi:hypothetical protein EYF80_044630 [Liparis tanakae]|uniref:Uncharacterized protein n=1 Tax=Liparis tanakae TaxID=230148 RepID=A0A4Z2FW91_9TELE|nr:hypothetical protein EYF80_044630 [Liparis tanakae]
MHAIILVVVHPRPAVPSVHTWLPVRRPVRATGRHAYRLEPVSRVSTAERRMRRRGRCGEPAGQRGNNMAWDWREQLIVLLVLLNINSNGGGSSSVYGGFTSNSRLDQTRNLQLVVELRVELGVELRVELGVELRVELRVELGVELRVVQPSAFTTAALYSATDLEALILPGITNKLLCPLLRALHSLQGFEEVLHPVQEGE